MSGKDIHYFLLKLVFSEEVKKCLSTWTDLKCNAFNTNLIYL